MKGTSLSIRTLLVIVVGMLVVAIVIAISTQNLEAFSQLGSERINGTLTR